MDRMFEGDTRLKTINVSSGWQSSLIGSGVDMFKSCSNLVGVAACDGVNNLTQDMANPSNGYLTAAAAEVHLYYLNYTGDTPQVGTISGLIGSRTTLPEPIDKGYEFLGWYTTPNCADGTQVEYVDGQYMFVQESVNLYAKRQLMDYYITYELDGGRQNPNNVNVTEEIGRAHV